MDTPSFIVLAMLTGGFMGTAMGLFPLIVGWMLDYRKIGMIGFGCSIVAGMILGLIAAFPVTLGFTIYIAKQVKSERKSKVVYHPAPTVVDRDFG